MQMRFDRPSVAVASLATTSGTALSKPALSAALSRSSEQTGQLSVAAVRSLADIEHAKQSAVAAAAAAVVASSSAPSAEDDDSDVVMLLDDSPVKQTMSPPKPPTNPVALDMELNAQLVDAGFKTEEELVTASSDVPEQHVDVPIVGQLDVKEEPSLSELFSSAESVRSSQSDDLTVEPAVKEDAAETTDVVVPEKSTPVLDDVKGPIAEQPPVSNDKSTDKISIADAEPEPEPVAVPTVAPVIVEQRPPTATQKRKRSESPSPPTAHISNENDETPTVAIADEEPTDATNDTPPAAKRVCTELEQTSGANDSTLRDYIDRSAAADSIGDVQRHIAQLRSDIELLDELSAAKEAEWNNILHLKRCKEEIVVRLLRRQTVMQIMATKFDDELPPGAAGTQTASGGGQLVLTNGMQAAMAQLSGGGSSSSATVNTSALTSSAAAMMASRANMKSSDLAREKATTARLHRYVVCCAGM